MKKSIKPLSILFLGLILLFVSCREEEFEFIEGPQDEVLKTNSQVATLLQRTSTKDGSYDNIIDNASCISVQLPITVVVNGLEIRVDSEDDFDTIEDIFDDLDDDEDILEILFPITVILSDYTEIVISGEDELQDLVEDCSGENERDDDIECADIQYPVTASIFNSNNEVLDVITFTNDRDLYRFIDDLEDDDIVNLDFPITVVLFDGTEVRVNDLDTLEDVLDDASDDCDEDDDSDYNDDDCDSCTTEALTDLLTQCPNWRVDDLERNDQDLDEQYEGYFFDFNTDGTLAASSATNTYDGTWEATGTANNITLMISIPDLEDFNASWRVQEIEQEDDESEIELSFGDDELSFESDCGQDGSGDDGDDDNGDDSDDDNGDDSDDDSGDDGDDDNGDDSDDDGGDPNLSLYLTDGSWIVSTYLDDGTDETGDFTAYTFIFQENGVVTADNGSATNGTWIIQDNGNELILDFGTAVPLDEFNDDWDVLFASETRLELGDVSGGDDSTDTLIFIKQ